MLGCKTDENSEKLFYPSKILVVDDERDFLTVTEAFLGQNLPSHQILTAQNGAEALKIFDSKRPSVIVLDMMMPGNSGLLVLDKLKHGARRANQQPIVIMVTANPGKRHEMYAQSLGTFRYLRKPFEMKVLLDAVNEALALLQ